MSTKIRPEVQAADQQASASAKAQAEAWHALSVSQTAQLLQTDLESGLTESEARRRRGKHGSNRLQEEEKEPFWKEFIEELREPLILLLLFTGVLYMLLGEVGDGLTIFAVILLLNTIEVVNEQRAKNAIAALQKLAEPSALVVRDGEPQEIPVEEIVPGDVILLQAGRRVPADARLVESYGLALDESSLTGESLPVDKHATPVKAVDTPLAERANMVYSGTLVTRGRGKALVASIGMATEIGRVAGMARAAKQPRTPLQQAMDEVSKSLVWLALAFSVAIPALGVLITGQPLETMLLTGLSLAFATIPEEMPIIITMVLALGAYRLSQQKAIVKNLQAVETLGAVTVIATDKTGTLTENRMQVSQFYPEANREQILTAGALCNDALIEGDEIRGDPLEAALVRAARESGLDIHQLEKLHPRVTEFSFENLRKRMSVVTEADGIYHVWVKGAPESVLSVCTQQRTGSGIATMDDRDREQALKQAARMAGDGLRVIAFAQKSVPTLPASPEETESKLLFLGLAGLLDPPRQEVRQAIKVMRGAGIRSLMVTGDHPLTARAIASQVGLNGTGRIVTGPELEQLSQAELERAVQEATIFARTTPEHKLRLVQALQKQGARVAVTGDGVNDAPALAAADIGVAMGATGSDVAREAGDLVLADDNYTTIARAVAEGRHLFANLKKGVRYYLTIKVALVSVMLLPVLLGIPAPFAPVQIILMELFMDLAAAAAFVAEPAEGDLMRMPPREPQAPFMDRVMIAGILTSALGLFAAVSTAYLLTWYGGADQVTAQTVAFAAWMVGHVLLAFNMRSERQPILQVGFFSNRLMLVWGAVTLAFISLVTTVPFLQMFLKTRALNVGQWSLILICVVVGTFWLEVKKLVTFEG
jgi:Ca2+-transporting ATPase